MARKRLLIGVSAFAIAAGGTAIAAHAALPLAIDPKIAKDCGDVLPTISLLPASASASAPAAVPTPAWAQRGGAVNDASCLSHTDVAGVVAPRGPEDVA